MFPLITPAKVRITSVTKSHDPPSTVRPGIATRGCRVYGFGLSFEQGFRFWNVVLNRGLGWQGKELRILCACVCLE